MYSFNLDIVLTSFVTASTLEAVKKVQSRQPGSKPIAMAKEQTSDLNPSLNALTLVLVAAFTASYMVMLV